MIIDNIFRPWGKIDWVMNRMNTKEWYYLGCLSTEERCLASHINLTGKGLLSKSVFFEVVDLIDTKEHEDLRQANKAKLNHDGVNIRVERHELLEPTKLIVSSIYSFLGDSNGNIILDISCFPKRFFFIMLKFILKHKTLSNLVVIYSAPDEYSKDNLSDNPQPWMAIPTFVEDDETQAEESIVGLGFMPLGLPDELRGENYQGRKMHFLFPFPPGPPFTQRTWSFVKALSEYRQIDPRELIRVDSISLPEIFTKINALTDFGSKGVSFAPFGPKPMSLAMCLYACQCNSAVYYTQPTLYNPHYSIGVSSILAYCIVIGGRNLYQIENIAEELSEN